MEKFSLANRDLSWLSFNKQVLCEALSENIPLGERVNFIAIFSSNLDEFYRVRYPVIQLLAESTLDSKKTANTPAVKEKIDKEIASQLSLLGKILQKIKSVIRSKNIEWIYERKIPEAIKYEVAEFFRNQVLGKLQIIAAKFSNDKEIFAPNSQIFLTLYHPEKVDTPVFIPLPAPALSRFVSFQKGGKTYILFLEDIIKNELTSYRSEFEGVQFYTFKVNRNAEMNLDDDQSPKLAKRIRKEIKRREIGSPTRLLYQGTMPESLLTEIQELFHLKTANMVKGGTYHQLHDLFGFPLPSFQDEQPWKVTEPFLGSSVYFLEEILSRDILIHPPYHSYSPILRLFNEVAIHPNVSDIYLTIYRVAKNSKILQALITAALNGKKVTVFVELKARFDEENNLDWANRMKSAGIRIKYSNSNLKVHAKAALIKLNVSGKTRKIALLGTGNFNESTAKVYTDHFLFTSEKNLCNEVESVFKILSKNIDKPKKKEYMFPNLWVGKFNLKDRILEMIQGESLEALSGRRAEIFLKMNNLEEEDVIQALYQASNCGVSIRLLIRGICRLIPGKKNQSERIVVKRIVDHFLEHGRVFSFYAGGKEEVFLGSADWMDRNLSRRIEICFPILDPKLKSEICTLMEIQWKDNQKSVTFPKVSTNQSEKPIRSQEEICELLSKPTK